MRYLGVSEIIHLHHGILDSTGGSPGIRDLAALKSAVAQPRLTFAGEDLYSTLFAKAAALGFALVMGHPFLDGNKRVGHAAIETILILNGYEISQAIDEQEAFFLSLASGKVNRAELLVWIESNAVPTKPGASTLVARDQNPRERGVRPVNSNR